MKRRILACLMTLVLLATFVSGCGSKEAASVSKEEEPYTVHFLYLVAQEGADQEEVEAAVDALAMKELNMHVDLIPMTLGVYESQLPVLMASGQDLDIAPVLNRFYASFLDSEYLVNMADLLQYAPDVTELLGDEATAVKMGDFLLGLPMMKERTYQSGLVVRKDIMDELGLSAEDFDVNTDDYSSYQQITDLFAKVKEIHPEMICLDGTYIMGTQTDTYIDNVGNYFGVLEDYGRTTKITNWFESEQFKTFCDIARDWYESGYLSKDIAVNSDSGEVKMKAGNTFSFMSILKPNTAQEKESQTGYAVEIIPVSESMISTGSLSLQTYSIAAASKDPVKAMKFLNWAYTNSEFNDLINWGIEGKHWIVDDNGNAAFPEGVTLANVGYHNDFGWAYPNQFLGHPWAGNDADIWEQYEASNNSPDNIKSEAFGFMFDQVDYADEISQLNAVYEQYKKDLAFGTVEIEPTLKMFNDALYAAGLQKVMDGKQAQLDAWLAENK